MANKEVENKIQKFVNDIDRCYKHEIRSNRRIIEYIVLYVIIVVLDISVILFIITRIQPYVNSSDRYITALSMILTVSFSFLFGLFPLLFKISFKLTPKEVIEWNYKKMKKGCEEEPLLLSLITMKNKQPLLSLSKLDKSFLNSQQLMERLYE